MFTHDGDRREMGKRLSAALLLLLLVLAGRLVHLQILGRAVWERRSVENRIRPERIEALRGAIRDRNGVLLATNRPAFSVGVVPAQVKGKPEVYDALEALLGVPAAEIAQTVREEATHPYDEVRVRRDVDIQTVARIEERRLDLPGVVVIAEPVREYPFREVGCHALGYIAEIRKDELEAMRARGYRQGDVVGRSGVEKRYEEVLRGEDGTRFLLEDAHGRVIREVGEEPPTPGNVLVLSLDWRMQEVADSVLGDHRAGALVALDPRDGSILALASHPGFDPNLFAIGIGAQAWRDLNSDPSHPLIDRAVQSAYPPGSTYKLVTAALALEDRVIGPGTLFRGCGGGYTYGARFFRCWEAAGHGQLAVADAIVHSCDVFFYQVGERMSLLRFEEEGKRFGFGRKTGIDLPQEVKGLVPGPGYYDERFGRSRWTRGVQLNLAIGQGELLVTPLQLAVFFGTLGLGGEMHAPHVLRRIETFEGRTVDSFRDRAETVPIDRGAWRVLTEALAGVVERGTARTSRIEGIRVAGKTGTAQNPHGLEHAWFVAYAPVEAPEIVVALIVEQAGHGGTVAAPLVRRVLEEHFGTVVAMEAP